MFGIKTIDIYVRNLDSEILLSIDVVKREYSVNESKRMILRSQIEDLIRIIRSWKNEYYSDNSLDREEFTIKIVTDKGEEVLHGKGSYPENYGLFKDWLGEVYVG